MKCPNCNKEMKDNSYSYYGLGSWDMDYPDCYHEEYVCRACKISYINGEWQIPDSLIATEKQIKAAEFISNILGFEIPPHTKKMLWQFIHDNLQEAIKAREELIKRNEQSFDDWCWDNAHWLPEYF